MTLLKSGAFWIIISYATSLFFSVPPNRKKAYSEHYQGSLLYAEGQLKRANQKFKNAYQILPDNFYFALSYGISEGRLGHASSGLTLIQQANTLLKRADEEYHYKKAICLFSEGMVHAYNQDFDSAFRQIQSALYALPDSASAKSIMLNNLGYLQLLNQSKNLHKTKEVASHMHIRKHDLEKAHTYFEQALQADDENGVAFYNYKLLSDTLGLETAFHAPVHGAQARAQTDRPTFLNMHQHVYRTLELGQYDELAFMVDISGSMVAENVICMGSTRFEVMKDLGRKIVADLPASTQLGIGTIGGDCPDEPAKWKPSGTMTRRELDTDLRFLIPDGTTPLLTRLLRAPELFTDSTQTKKSIFLISDGANTCREAGLDICDFAEELSQKGITVNVLTFLSSTFNNTSAFSEYICLADNTGGKVVYMDNLRCYFETFDFDLTKACQLQIPTFQKSTCWGKHIETLWMYSPDNW